LHNGQSCIAAKRFIVAESIAEKMGALKVGDPFEKSTELGPLSMPEGVADLDCDVRKTVEAGTKILTGGKLLDSRGNFYTPAILINIPKDSPDYKEERFGPVATTAALVWASAGSNDRVEQERFMNE
jgi:succinate-semialdehyde dehydrogenase / glutarate-semialdehyde dehydrogenase